MPAQYRVVLNDLGLAETHRQHYEAAKDHLTDALQRYEQATPEGSQWYASTMHNLGVLNRYLRDEKQAEIWYLKALAMYGRFVDPCDPNASKAGAGLGSALNAQNKAGEAEAVLLTRSKQNDSCPVLSPYVKGLTLRVLAETQARNGKEAEALQTIDSAINLVKQARGGESLELAYALVDRASVLRRLGRFAECQKAAALAIPMLEHTAGSGSAEVGTAKYLLGDTLRNEGKLEAALEEYTAAEKIYRLSLGENHPWRATLLIWMARVTRALGRKPEADRLFREAERIGIAGFGSESPEVARIREAMEDTDGK
jgi:tetratricopeptide (TPR) repeat protein